MDRSSENPEPADDSLRARIIGLGDRSFRKSYYPQLQQRLVELEKSRQQSEAKSVALLKMLEDLEQTRAQLADSEARYRSLVENIDDAIFSLDREGAITYISPAIIKLSGYLPEEITGRQFREFFNAASPESLAAVVTGVRSPCELQIADNNGRMHYLRASSRPLLKEGRSVGVIGILSDITEQKQAQEEVRKLNAELDERVRQRTQELAESEERMRLFFEHQVVGTAIISPQKTWVEFNDKLCQMLGFSREELRQRTWEELTFPEDLPADLAQFERLLRGEIEFYMLEKRFVRKDGSLVFTNLAVSCRRGANRSVDYVVALLEDISDRKRAEENIRKLNEQLQQRATLLEAANKELEAFSYSVSHDLRAPLRSIDGFSMALMKDYADKFEDDAKQYLDSLRAASQRMGHLIDDILQLSRISRGELRRSQVDLSALALSVANSLQSVEPQRTVQLAIEPECVALADGNLMRVVLENLIGNAWKFTGKTSGARIEFGSMEAEGGDRVFFVRDNGAGFDQRHAERLFGAFQRLHTSNEFPGTGIGLASVQRIIRRHGGKVWIEGKVGEGATAYFTLPENASRH